MYFGVFVWLWHLFLILLFNQMHCMICGDTGGASVAIGPVTMIIRILVIVQNIAQSWDTLERVLHCNRKLRSRPEI